jgi:peptidoglycan/xylan/chitin deacetylase (PgdA/CDA1 family)
MYSYSLQEIFIDFISKSILARVFRKSSERKKRIILGYHGIEPNHPLCINPEIFKEQMIYIKENFSVVPIEIIVSNSGIESKSNLISVTFDDAYLNFRIHALKVLNDLKIPATVFVPTEFIGSSNKWDVSRKELQLKIMSRRDLKEVALYGVKIGSHTKRHLRLKKQSTNVIKEEVNQSKNELEEILGSKVLTFAYPYGGVSDYDYRAVSAIQEAGYHSAVTTCFGRFNNYENRYELKRVSVLPHDSKKNFISKLYGQYDWVEAKEKITKTYLKLF